MISGDSCTSRNVYKTIITITSNIFQGRLGNPTKQQWDNLYKAAKELLRKRFIKKIIQASYNAIYVDEYQDCSELQHALISTIADIIPCCIFGDPLQAIFDFKCKPVDWDKDIYPQFTELGELDTPWRWHNAGAPDYGNWLKDIRQKLINNDPIDMSGSLPKEVKFCLIKPEEMHSKQRGECFDFLLPKGEEVIAIHKGDYKAKCHKLANTIGGAFSSIEEIEGSALAKFISKYESTSDCADKLKIAIKFARLCMSNITTSLSAGTIRGEIVKISNKTKHPILAAKANSFLESPSSLNLKTLFQVLRKTHGIKTYRRDLLNRMISVLLIHSHSPSLTLKDAFIQYQSQFRHTGRPITYPKQISTTLLVKGLEYEHAIILDAASLSKKELYVALTRASKTLIIISSSKLLNKK